MLKIIIFIIGILFTLGLIFWLIGERGRFMRRSTRVAFRTLGIRRFLKLETLHFYLYARWTKQYISFLINFFAPRVNNLGKKWLADRHHAKILTTEQAKAIVSLDHDIAHHDIEQIIPYPMAKKIILQAPPAIVAYECGCRHIRKNSCQPTQVCMVIGQPIVDFVLEHHPKNSKLLTQIEAVELLRSEHERGHIHSAWFKDVVFDRFYVICNCCKCCCGGIEAMVKYNNPMMVSSGYVAHVDLTKCKKCGMCVKICPFNALALKDSVILNWDKCMGCGACISQCKTGAITLLCDEKKGIPLDVRALKS